MKQLVCEMCGSNDLVKSDGNFVCQTCGTKYSVEEAKKMMIEGTVEVTGTVKIDEDSKLSNYKTIAKSAIDAGNNNEAEIYCNKIIEIDPTCSEAWFIKAQAAGWSSTRAVPRLDEATNYFIKAIDLTTEDKDDLINAAANQLFSLSLGMMGLYCDAFADYPSKDNENELLEGLEYIQHHYYSFCDNHNEIGKEKLHQELATKMNTAVCAAWDNVITNDYKHSDNPSTYEWENFQQRSYSCMKILTQALLIYKNKQYYLNLITITENLANSCSYTYSYEWARYVKDQQLSKEVKNSCYDNIAFFHEQIKEIDPSYVIPEPKKSGCYVATAVYGSYDCPQVWTLRRYRDFTLAKTWYGKAFIKTYYSISPTLVKYFGGTKLFKFIIKLPLDRFVRNLQEKGVESSPYEDPNYNN